MTPTTTQRRKGGKVGWSGPVDRQRWLPSRGFQFNRVTMIRQWSRVWSGRKNFQKRFSGGISRGNNESRSYRGTVCYRNWKDGSAHKEQKGGRERARDFSLSNERARAHARQGAGQWAKRKNENAWRSYCRWIRRKVVPLSRHIRQWASTPYPPLFPLLPLLFF